MDRRYDHPEVCHRVPELGNVGRHLKVVYVTIEKSIECDPVNCLLWCLSNVTLIHVFCDQATFDE